MVPRLGQGPDDCHAPGAGRLVHLPAEAVGHAHPCVLLQALR